MTRIFALLVIILFCMGSFALAEMPKDEYLARKDSTTAVILAHGKGFGPDSRVGGDWVTKGTRRKCTAQNPQFERTGSAPPVMRSFK